MRAMPNAALLVFPPDVSPPPNTPMRVSVRAPPGGGFFSHNRHDPKQDRPRHQRTGSGTDHPLSGQYDTALDMLRTVRSLSDSFAPNLVRALADAKGEADAAKVARSETGLN